MRFPDCGVFVNNCKLILRFVKRVYEMCYKVKDSSESFVIC